MKFISKSVVETEVVATQFVEQVLRLYVANRYGSTKAVVVGLYGNLGSGKTAFTQALARVFGIKESVTSPTFVIEKLYPIVPSLSDGLSPGFSLGFTQLVHIDVYRLDDPLEMEHLGWNELLQNPANLIVIEWPERLERLLPKDHIKLRFTFIDETTREIEVVQ